MADERAAMEFLAGRHVDPRILFSQPELAKSLFRNGLPAELMGLGPEGAGEAHCFQNAGLDMAGNDMPRGEAESVYDDGDKSGKLRRCIDCEKSYPSLKALNRCSTCYQRLYKRRRRALAQQLKNGKGAAMGCPGPADDMSTTTSFGGAAGNWQFTGQPSDGLDHPALLGLPQPEQPPQAPVEMPDAGRQQERKPAMDERLKLLLKISSLLEACKTQRGGGSDSSLGEIESMLVHYMNMEESKVPEPTGADLTGVLGSRLQNMQMPVPDASKSYSAGGFVRDTPLLSRKPNIALGGKPGGEGSPMFEAHQASQAASIQSNGSHMHGGSRSGSPLVKPEQRSEAAEGAANKDWQNQPGVCSPFDQKTKSSRRRLRQVEVLLAVGLLREGDLLYYKSRSGKVLAAGTVKGTGIKCHRCSQIVGATEFEQCAGSGLRRPCENIYTHSEITLQDLLVKADKIMLDRARVVRYDRMWPQQGGNGSAGNMQAGDMHGMNGEEGFNESGDEDEDEEVSDEDGSDDGSEVGDDQAIDQQLLAEGLRAQYARLPPAKRYKNEHANFGNQ